MSSEGASMPQNGVLSVENTTVEVIVPSTSSTIIKDALDSGEGSAAENSTSLLPSIQQRQFLFFGKLDYANRQHWNLSSYSFIGM